MMMSQEILSQNTKVFILRKMINFMEFFLYAKNVTINYFISLKYIKYLFLNFKIVRFLQGPLKINVRSTSKRGCQELSYPKRTL